MIATVIASCFAFQSFWHSANLVSRTSPPFAIMSACNPKTQDDVSNEWNAMAGEWDDLASSYRDAFENILWEVTGLQPSDKRVVLDFGCGTGLLTESMRRVAPDSHFLSVDAAPSMVRVLSEKIRAGEWENVEAYCAILADLEKADATTREAIDAKEGTVDLAVASSVMSFVPKSDLKKTMKGIAKLLKPGGVFVHSDWPPTDDEPDGFTADTAAAMYAMGGLELVTTTQREISMGPEKAPIFVGVAKKPSLP